MHHKYSEFIEIAIKTETLNKTHVLNPKKVFSIIKVFSKHTTLLTFFF